MTFLRSRGREGQMILVFVAGVAAGVLAAEIYLRS
jgi:hypothetical protein